jgi:hypothetical protein
MKRSSAACKSFWRAAVTCGLCVLAFAFFTEAKSAWYSPASSPGFNVISAKAMPADTPKIIEHGIPVPDPIHPQVPFALLAALITMWAAFCLPILWETTRHRLRFSLLAFSPQVFFRPPPIL